MEPECTSVHPAFSPPRLHSPPLPHSPPRSPRPHSPPNPLRSHSLPTHTVHSAHTVRPTHLVQLLTGEVGIDHNEAILLLGQAPHATVGLPVMEGQGGEVVEGGVQVVGDMG